MKKLTKVVKINRAKWRTGGHNEGQSGEGETRLLNQEGYMCCLGFASHQIGKMAKETLEGAIMPSSLGRVISPLVKRSESGKCINTRFSNECAHLNDSNSITRKQREYRLKRKFNAQGIDLQFVGKYEDKEKPNEE